MRTFHEATRLATAEPATTEEAQYSLPFPVAVAVARGRVAAADVDGPTLSDPEVLSLSRRVRLVEDAALSGRFPAERLAQVELRLRDGTVRVSDVLPPRGMPENPLTDAELSAKFHELADPVLGVRAEALEQALGEPATNWECRASRAAPVRAGLRRGRSVGALTLVLSPRRTTPRLPPRTVVSRTTRRGTHGTHRLSHAIHTGPRCARRRRDRGFDLDGRQPARSRLDDSRRRRAGLVLVGAAHGQRAVLERDRLAVGEPPRSAFQGHLLGRREAALELGLQALPLLLVRGHDPPGPGLQRRRQRRSRRASTRSGTPA